MDSILDLERGREASRVNGAGTLGRMIPPSVRDYVHRVPAAFAERQAVNVNKVERVVSVLLGAALVGYGLFRALGGGRGRGRARSTLAAAAGGALVERGLSGRCALYRALRVSTA
jgi:hypothetical protein